MMDAHFTHGESQEKFKELIRAEETIKLFFYNNSNSTFKNFYEPLNDIFQEMIALKPFIEANSSGMVRYEIFITTLAEDLNSDNYKRASFINANGKIISENLYKVYLTIRDGVIKDEYNKLNSQKDNGTFSLEKISLPALPMLKAISSFKKTSFFNLMGKKINKIMSHIYNNFNFIKFIGYAFVSFLSIQAISYFLLYRNENNQMEKMTDILQSSFNTFSVKRFSEEDFMKLVILTENKNQEILQDEKWDIRYNKLKKVIVFNATNLSENVCRNFVVNKEISYDSAHMQVNKISLPVNYWTASTSENWTQKVNQDLCSSGKNDISIAIDANFANHSYLRQAHFKKNELQFLINQHRIAKNFHNSTLIDIAISKKINQLESFKISNLN